MSYTPQPGSAAQRAIEWLLTFPFGTHKGSLDIARAIGIRPEHVAGSLQTAVKHGTVICVKGARGLCSYSMPLDDGAAAPAAPEPSAKVEKQEVNGAVTMVEPEPDAEDEDARVFDCALWSDGELQLQLGDESVVLSVDETRKLVRYLDRIAVEEGAA